MIHLEITPTQLCMLCAAMEHQAEDGSFPEGSEHDRLLNDLVKKVQPVIDNYPFTEEHGWEDH